MPSSSPRLLTVLWLSLAACGPSYVERPTQVTFAPGSADFWALPLPSDLRAQSNGTLGLDRYPGRRTALSTMWLTVANKRLTTGWGVSGGVFFTTTGEVDPATLPATVEAARGKDASVFLIDVDPDSPERGRRFEVTVEFTSAGAGLHPGHLLGLVPVIGFVRRPNTTYAAVITDAVHDTAGQPLGRSPQFHAAWEVMGNADPEAMASFELLREQLRSEGVDLKRVVGATVFRTMNPPDVLRRLVAWEEAQPAPTGRNFVPAESYPDFTVMVGTYTVPKIQDGDLPGHGLIEWNSDGSPKQSGTQDTRVVLAIPKTPMPAAGYPLLIYFHGSGGEAYEVVDRGPLPQDKPRDQAGEPAKGSGPAAYLARLGIASLGFDFPLHGKRKNPPDTSGLELYNLFGDIDSTVDNFSVAAMEGVLVSRLAIGLQVPMPSGATVRFDPERLSAMGHSMGSTLGIPIASVDPRIKGFIFSGSGGTMIDVALSTTYPQTLKPFVELLLDMPADEHLWHGHPLLHVFQNLWDFDDPTTRAGLVAKSPAAPLAPRPYLQFAGQTDGYFHPLAQQAIAVSLGGPLVGEVVEQSHVTALALDGRATASYPLHGNLNGVTGGLVQYQTPFELGHYVVFDMEQPRHQMLCFVQAVGSASGPSIVAPASDTAPCQ